MSLPPLPGMGATTKEENYDKITAWANAVGALALNALPIKGVLGNVNLNTVVAPGIYRQSSTTNATKANGYPIEGHTWVIEVFHWDVGAPVQRLTPITGPSGMRGFIERRIVNSELGTWGQFTFVPSQRVDQAAGRVIYVWDFENNREQRIYGDSGVMDVTSLLKNGWVANKVQLTRTNNQIEVLFFGLSGASATDGSFLDLPSGFRPYSTISFDIGSGSINARSYEADLVRSTTAPRLGDQYNAKAITFRATSSWPTALPVTPGAIPNL